MQSRSGLSSIRVFSSGLVAATLAPFFVAPFVAHAQSTGDAAPVPPLGNVAATALPATPPTETLELGSAEQVASHIYLPADFARFAPRTALDMVDNIPDFALTDSSSDRGLGAASQNVLINGHRITSKSDDAGTVLGRIAATSVQRIEVLDGARLGIPGLTGRVANVVVTNSAVRFQYRWDGQVRQHIDDQVLTGALSASGRIGGTDFSLSLSNLNGIRRGGLGREIMTEADGTLILTRDELAEYHADRPRLAGSIHREFTDASVLNLNLAGELYRYDGLFTGVVTPADGSAKIDELFHQTEHEWNVAGGGDYEFALGNGRLKLIGLQSYEHSPFTNQFTRSDHDAGTIISGSRFVRTANEGESVVRAEYGWPGNGGEWQVALEGAYNFLDITSALETYSTTGRLTPIDLSGANTFVDEWRSELMLTRGWTLAAGVTLQTSVGGEYSRIRQTSAGGLSRSFWRPKGTAALAWTVNPRTTINASIKRDVGQLSFYDFSSAVDIQNGTPTAGNVSLVPEQSWRADISIAQSLGTLGSITLGGYAEAITDIVDSVPISATEEGIGNLPSARRLGLTARGTLLLDSIGWRGARINLNADFRNSRVRDPITGDYRPISLDLRRSWSVDFRQDIPGTAIAWGGQLTEERNAPDFRLDQVSDSSLTRPISVLYIEHKDVLGMTVRLGMRNLLNGHDDIRRDVSLARRDGPIDFYERQRRHIGRVVTLSINGTF